LTLCSCEGRAILCYTPTSRLRLSPSVAGFEPHHSISALNESSLVTHFNELEPQVSSKVASITLLVVLTKHSIGDVHIAISGDPVGLKESLNSWVRRDADRDLYCAADTTLNEFEWLTGQHTDPARWMQGKAEKPPAINLSTRDQRAVLVVAEFLFRPTSRYVVPESAHFEENLLSVFLIWNKRCRMSQLAERGEVVCGGFHCEMHVPVISRAVVSF